MNNYRAKYKHHILNISAKSIDEAKKEAIAYFIRYGSPSKVRKNLIIIEQPLEIVLEDYNMDWPTPSPTVSTKDVKENPSETVSKAKEIIDGKFLEDYFYNS